jgi:hypothetical protein
MDKKLFDQLAEIYEDAGYPSLAKFKGKLKQNGMKVSHKDAQSFLTNQEQFQVFKKRDIPQKKFFPIYGAPNSWQMDTAFMPRTFIGQPGNRKKKAIMTIININTRKAFAHAATEATAKEAVELIDKVLDAGEEIDFIGTDLGGEFKSAFKAKMREIKATHIQHEKGKDEKYDHNHMGKVERLNRTFKDIMMRLLEGGKTKIWVPLIEKIEKIYNTQEHSAIGKAPNDVTDEDEKHIILQAQLKTRQLLATDKFEVGDRVRIPVSKDLFSKWGINFSKELYQIHSRSKTDPDTGKQYGLSYKLTKVGSDEILPKRFKHYDLVLAKGGHKDNEESLTESAHRSGKQRAKSKRAANELKTFIPDGAKAAPAGSKRGRGGKRDRGKDDKGKK